VGSDAGGVDAAFIINLYGGHATLAERSGRATWDAPTMKHEGRLEGHEITSRVARIDVKYDAQVRFGGAAVDAMILNVSSNGFRLHSAEELEPGMDVTLEVETLEPVHGQIRWSCGQESGGVFLEAIAL
jgi:hypothetical protein